jgi:hypothetical protein
MADYLISSIGLLFVVRPKDISFFTYEKVSPFGSSKDDHSSAISRSRSLLVL